jgi:protein-S-isoprenylcysteine O-methyltransferase Ste14
LERVDTARKLTAWNHLRAVVLLPFMNTVVVPSALLLLFPESGFRAGPAVVNLIAFCLAVPIISAGFALAARAVWLFVKRGGGTLAPWDPTSVLIAVDIYRYTRNPMKLGLFLILIGECILLRSEALAIWTACFIVANAIYIRVSEEPGLRARFGTAYDGYCSKVPRWIGSWTIRHVHSSGHAHSSGHSHSSSFRDCR